MLNEANRANIKLFDTMDAQVVHLQADAASLDSAQKKRHEFDQQLAGFLDKTQPPDGQGHYGLALAEMTAVLTNLQKSACYLRAYLGQISPTLTESGGLKGHMAARGQSSAPGAAVDTPCPSWPSCS